MTACVGFSPNTYLPGYCNNCGVSVAKHPQPGTDAKRAASGERDEPIREGEQHKYQRLTCCVCETEAVIERGVTESGWARVSRGCLAAQDIEGRMTDAEKAELENIKFERFICPICFMGDPDLCEFFNKIGLKVR